MKGEYHFSSGIKEHNIQPKYTCSDRVNVWIKHEYRFNASELTTLDQDINLIIEFLSSKYDQLNVVFAFLLYFY